MCNWHAFQRSAVHVRACGRETQKSGSLARVRRQGVLSISRSPCKISCNFWTGKGIHHEHRVQMIRIVRLLEESNV